MLTTSLTPPARATAASAAGIGEASAVDPVTALLWPHRDRVTAPGWSLEAARELDEMSARRRAIPVRKIFVRSDTDTAPPLSRLYQAGGRGGLVAIQLYLGLVWVCSAPPYRTNRPGRSWAMLLGLEDPEGKGVRRIAAASKALQRARLISVTYEPGRGNTTTILDESGNGDDYLLPSTQYIKAAPGPRGEEQRRRNTYLKIPTQLWTRGEIQSLSGPGLVMLLILLAEDSGPGGDPVWFSTTAFPARYRISHKTRAAGTKELQDRGLLDVERQALPDVPGTVFTRRRYRNLYRLTLPPADA